MIPWHHQAPHNIVFLPATPDSHTSALKDKNTATDITILETKAS